jgi:tetratricopeptide (TPR) repeat protein
VGNLHPAVARAELPWLGRLARLGERWRVAICNGAAGEGCQDLLRRARIVFHPGTGSECIPQALQAAAAGTLVVQAAGNGELAGLLRAGTQYVAFRDKDLEALLEHYLTHEQDRQAIAAAGHDKAADLTFARLWEGVLARIEEEWPLLEQRSQARPVVAENEALLGRTWELLCGADPHADPTLVRDLAAYLAGQKDAAALHNALGLAIACSAQQDGRITAAVAGQALDSFRRTVAADPAHLLAGLNLAEALVVVEQHREAIAQARRTLAVLDRAPLSRALLDGAHFPAAWDHFRVEWERAAWDHAGQPEQETQAKGRLLRWRLHALLADLNDDLAHHYEAMLARPDLPPSRAGLGFGLARAGRPVEAIPHLRRALADNPFDPEAARALFHLLGETGNRTDELRLAADRRLLSRAAPEVVPEEPWFAEASTPDLMALREAAAHQPEALARLAAPAAAAHQSEALARQAVSLANASGWCETHGHLERPDGSSFAPEGDGPTRGANGRQNRVSLCMIVKDEEANLPACLESVAGLVQEIVIVDTGSRDGTRQVADRFGARVFDFPWVDSFAAARNESLRHATGDWILWLDADDRLDEAKTSGTPGRPERRERRLRPQVPVPARPVRRRGHRGGPCAAVPQSPGFALGAPRPRANPPCRAPGAGRGPLGRRGHSAHRLPGRRSARPQASARFAAIAPGV